METITFNCRFITPAFLGGADPKGAPELRPPSIKGALRFWWRAMNGHLISPEEDKNSAKALLKQDETLFGGINQSHSKSPVRIQAREIDMAYLMGQDVFDRTRAEGLDYLFYSLKHHRATDLGFDSDSAFELSFTALERNRNELQKAIASFWLLVHFGSLGTRARRGAGAFYVESILDKNGLLDAGISFIPDPGVSTQDFLKENFKKVKLLIGSELPTVVKAYSTINPEEPAVLSAAAFDSWREAVNAIGLEMRNIRKGKTSRVAAERTFTMRTLNKKAAFGLPLGVFSDNAVTFETKERRASPIYISVVYNQTTRKYHWILTHLAGDFMPEGEKIVFESKNRHAAQRQHSWNAEDDSLLQTFMNNIRAKSQAII